MLNNDDVTSLLRIFESPIEENHFTYNIKVVDAAGHILSTLVRQEDMARDFNLLERILKKNESLLQFTLTNELILMQWKNTRWVGVE
jgi:hypothetical protein